MPSLCNIVFDETKYQALSSNLTYFITCRLSRLFDYISIYINDRFSLRAQC